MAGEDQADWAPEDDTQPTNPRRSMLFVPADRPERFNRAENSGADMVCVDLEDALPVEHKSAGREAAEGFFARPPAAVLRLLRINAVESAQGGTDLQWLSRSEALPDLVLLPKVQFAREVEQAAKAVADRGVGLVAMIESPRGLLNALEVAEAHPAVKALMLGGADFAAELGVAGSWEALLYARGQLAVVAAACELQLIDSPCFSIDDTDLLAGETAAGIALGFTTKSAIHPAQIPVIHEQFLPGPEEIAAAQRIVDASRADGDGVVAVDGVMVDRPLLLSARRTLARAGLS